jgi:secreted trypsin-like serine protease
VHKNVGALIGFFKPEKVYFALCSGTLVRANLFLTAAHCVVGLPDDIEVVGVSFDATPSSAAPPEFLAAKITPHPDYPGPASDPHDLAIIKLDHAPKGIAFAALPALNQFTAMAKKNGLHGQQFTAVGYGDQERQHEPGTGSPDFGDGGTRMYAVSTFRALTDAWLRLSQNPSTGDGGTCYGDSGGPNFLGAPDKPHPVVAAVTVTGDSVCRATNVVYRLDTPGAQEFLAGFGLVGSPAVKKAGAKNGTINRAGGKRHRTRG